MGRWMVHRKVEIRPSRIVELGFGYVRSVTQAGFSGRNNISLVTKLKQLASKTLKIFKTLKS